MIFKGGDGMWYVSCTLVLNERLSISKKSRLDAVDRRMLNRVICFIIIADTIKGNSQKREVGVARLLDCVMHVYNGIDE